MLGYSWDCWAERLFWRFLATNPQKKRRRARQHREYCERKKVYTRIKEDREFGSRIGDFDKPYLH